MRCQAWVVLTRQPGWQHLDNLMPTLLLPVLLLPAVLHRGCGRGGQWGEPVGQQRAPQVRTQCPVVAGCGLTCTQVQPSTSHFFSLTSSRALPRHPSSTPAQTLTLTLTHHPTHHPSPLHPQVREHHHPGCPRGQPEPRLE